VKANGTLALGMPLGSFAAGIACMFSG